MLLDGLLALAIPDEVLRCRRFSAGGTACGVEFQDILVQTMRHFERIFKVRESRAGVGGPERGAKRESIDRIERRRDDFASQIERRLNEAQAAGERIEDDIAGLRVLFDGDM